MTLAPGARLVAYEVVSLLGTGGMGVVYRARDTRLHREVAIKVLPGLVASDPDRLARFQREAQVLAALNHPNIAQIYGLEESNGIRAIAMELVEGPTLAEKLASGSGLQAPDMALQRDSGSGRSLKPEAGSRQAGSLSAKVLTSPARSPTPSRRRTRRGSSTEI